MKRMPGGQGMGEGAQQLAGILLFVLLLVFFALAIRTEWDRRQGRVVPEWSEVLSKRQTRGLPPPARPKQSAPRSGDVI